MRCRACARSARHIAYEIEHISEHEQRVWLPGDQARRLPQALSAEEQRLLLERLSAVEALETYLHKAFLGKKQFSIEGLDTLVPMLDQAIELASDAGAREVVLGTAHRGRLNVLAHGQPAVRVDPGGVRGRADAVDRHGRARGRDRRRQVPLRRVRHIQDALGRGVTVTMSPSQPLEYVNPVIEGRSRADQTIRKARDLAHDPNAVLPILIHGDAAFPARGSSPRRSTRPRGLHDRRHAARDRQQPARLHHRPEREPLDALRIRSRQGLRHPDHPRQRRRRGGVHLGGTPGPRLPADVQPRRPDRPDRLPPLRPQRDRRAGLHAAVDVRAHQEAPAGAPALRRAAGRRGRRLDRGGGPDREPGLRAGRRGAHGPEGVDGRPARDRPARARPHDEPRAAHDRGRGDPARSATSCCACPTASKSTASSSRSWIAGAPRSSNRTAASTEGPRRARVRVAARPGSADPLDRPDTERGTFSQRHAVLHDSATGDRWCALQTLRDANAPFELHNSPLSEQACLGFEYGYWSRLQTRSSSGRPSSATSSTRDRSSSTSSSSRASPSGARVAADAAAAARIRGLGPEHSSARLERSCRWRRGTSAWPTAPRRRSTSTCCGGRRWCSRAR